MLKQFEVQNIYIGEAPYDGDELCFTANTANSTVQLTKTGNPTSITLETSADGKTWNTYTINTNITLSNIGDKVYIRNTSETTTAFSIDDSNYYRFVMSGSISASGDISSLVNKNNTTTLAGTYTFTFLFSQCSSLTTTPTLKPTTLTEWCYSYMFGDCTNLETLPKLPATTLTARCYVFMFGRCSKIKLSSTKTGNYQTEYRIPTTGTGTAGTASMGYMFQGTGGTISETPTINTTYYTSNTVV